MHKGDGFSAKPLGESLFHCQNVLSGHGPTGQFWLLESVIRGLELKSLKFKDVITEFFSIVQICWKLNPTHLLLSLWNMTKRMGSGILTMELMCKIHNKEKVPASLLLHFCKLPVHTSCNIKIQILLFLFCLKEGRLAEWSECWMCNSEALEVHSPPYLLSRFVLGSPECKSLATLVKEPTGLPPPSWDS